LPLRSDCPKHALAIFVRAGILCGPGIRRERIFVADVVIRVLEGRSGLPPLVRQGAAWAA